MVNKILISVCLFLSLVAFSQESTSSPYSFYGIGEQKFNGAVENRSMGGLSIAPDSTHINLQNPANIANLRRTTFTLAGSGNYTKQKTSNASEVAQRSTFDYLALGVPLGKFGAIFGIIPHSSVGYKIENITPDGSQNNERFNGWGGVNRVFVGTGYQIRPNLTVGVNAYYNFGKIQTNSLEFIPYVPIGSRELNVNELSGMSFDIAMMYQTKISAETSLFSSVNFTPKSALASHNTRTIGTVVYNSNYDLQNVDMLDPIYYNTNMRIAQKWEFGAGIGDQKKWMFGAQFSVQGPGDLQNSYDSIDNVSYENTQKYSFGGYYIPNSSPYVSYAKRIAYRAGFKHEKTGLVINSTSINDVSGTFGVGLPVMGSLSNVNVGFEFGKKGTTAAGLVQENYFNMSIGVSLNDKWFERRKFY